MVPFAGWEMPLSYSGVPDEHHAVRTAVGLFDISHMGRFELSDREAEAYLDHITLVGRSGIGVDNIDVTGPPSAGSWP